MSATQDGDSVTLSYTGGWDAKSDKGDHQLISGTGKFEGTAGTG
ncbi:hypothetical protein [Benzoatithermus flavus]|uniref:Peptidylprolyl isomerase n=1 Tax=Benzoatithermus flavus TaxID=3108223 RepID=A0ABU8XXS0_9PROT